MQFEIFLQKKLGNHNPQQVDQLLLEDLFNNVSEFTSDHKETLEKYKNMVHLSLNNVGLTSLRNFPKFPNLEIVKRFLTLA